MGFSNEEMQVNMAEWPGQDLKEGFLDARSAANQLVDNVTGSRVT